MTNARRMLAVTVAVAVLAAVGGAAVASLVAAAPGPAPAPLPVVKGPVARAGPEPSRGHRMAPVPIAESSPVPQLP